MDIGMGSRIEQRRKELGYTMERLGEMVGVQKSAVNKWEKGHVERMKQTTISLVANALECSPVWLMFGDEKDTAPNNNISLGLEDAEILKKIHKLSPSNKSILLSTIDIMLANQDS